MKNLKYIKLIVSCVIVAAILFGYTTALKDTIAWEDDSQVEIPNTDDQGESDSGDDTTDEPATYSQTEEYNFDTIVNDAEEEKEYRDSVKYVENTIVFSVIQYRKTGDKASYITDKDDLCKKYSMKNVSFILELKVKNVEQKEGYDSYQMFYNADVVSEDIWQLVDALREDTRIFTAEPDFMWEKSAEDDMTEVSGEALVEEVEAAGWCFDDLDCVNLWNNLTPGHAPGEGVVVAVIDTGVDYNHNDLKNNMWTNPGEIPDNKKDDDGNGYVDDVHGINLIDTRKQGDPMDDMGHGTHVAGIIAMSAGNGGGVGIAYGSKIMAVKAGQANGTFASTDIAKAIQYASANGADVINMSFGGTGKSALVEAALEDAFGSCVLIAAAGNDGLPTTDAPPVFVLKEDFYPAGYSYVIGVMACDNAGRKASFSNWDYYKYANCEYEMMAPGVSLFSCIPTNKYAKWSGTSMAAPVVSAVAAIIRREKPDKSRYSSRFIMGQLSSATKDSVAYVDAISVLHSYNKLNIYDSLNLTPTPDVSISDIHIFDSKEISPFNNNDGVVQSGEVLDLGFVLFNHNGIAKDIVVDVDSLSVAGVPNSYVEFINNRVELTNEIGTMATTNNGFLYNDDMLVGVDNPIRIKISDEAPNDLIISINFSLSSKNAMDNTDPTIYSCYYTYSFNVQRGTYLRGTINEDLTLTPDKLWIIDRALVIDADATVTVEPGTKIQFYSIEEGPYAENHIVSVVVHGQMIFNGTLDKPIEIFPCKGRENFKVDISYVQDAGSALLMNYVKILNPNLIISQGNHLYLYQNDDCVYGFKDNGVVEIEKDIQLKIRGIVSNSVFQWFFRPVQSCFYTCEFDGKCDTVLFNENYMHFGSYPLNNQYIYPYVANIKNCVMLNNYREGRPSRLYINERESHQSSLISNNAILNDRYYDLWFKIGAMSDVNLANNYWGTNNEELIRKMIIDSEDIASFGVGNYMDYLTLDDDMSSIYPFVTEAFVTDLDGNRLTEVTNSQLVQVHVRFNRDMSQDKKYAPMVSFGPAEPYTDYVVNGDWVSAREWVGTITIDPFINQGTNYLRIKDAAAADDLWLTTGTDAARFSFDVTKTSAEALTLQGSGGSNHNYLNWVQDEFDTLAGYNLYRSMTYNSEVDVETQRFTKINNTIIPNSEFEFTDTDVEQGQDYYYYFTVVDTDFNESHPSNVVKCTPLDEESPVIVTNAIDTRTVGEPITMSANVTDNVAVTEVDLFYKMSTNDVWQQDVMRNTTGDSYQAVIPVYAIEEGTLQYYIVAHDGTNDTYCGNEELPNVISIVGVIEVESVSLDKVDVSLQIGSQYTLTAIVLPEDATYQNVTWSSSDENIVTVDNGVLTAVGVGTATITVTSFDGSKSAICNVAVNPILATELSISEDNKELLIGEIFDIGVSILPDNTTDKSVKFESGDENVVTVDETGRVTTVGVGETDVTITTNDASGLFKVCHVTVNPIKVQAVALNCVSKTLEINDSFDLSPVIYPSNATDQTVDWLSDDEQVATVDNGLVVAVGLGKTTITVTTTDGAKKAICNVEVVHSTGHTVVVDPAIVPDCENTGLTEGSHCSVCGEIIDPQEVIPALGHTLEIDEAVAPDCTHTGLTEGSHCTVCNKVVVEQEVLPMADHTVVIDPAVSPDCTHSGFTEGCHCSVCDEVIIAQEEIAARGHAVVVDEAVEPGCTSTGLTEGSHCSVCNEIIVAQEVIEATGHTVVMDAAVTTDCTHIGKTAGCHCSVCGKVIVSQEDIPMMDHTVVIDPSVEPDCTNAGLTEGSHCSACGQVIIPQEEIPANGHTIVIDPLVEANCSHVGYTEGCHCSVCGEVIVAPDEIPMTDHTVVTDPMVEPDCTHSGLTEGSHCSVCGEVIKEQETIKANGHTIVIIPAEPADCTHVGHTTGCCCSVCNEVIIPVEEIPAKGHTIVIDPAVEADYTHSGLTEGSHCSVCGEVIVAQTVIPALPTPTNPAEPTTKPVITVTTTPKPTEKPSVEPSVKPSVTPTQAPTINPTAAPTKVPTKTPSMAPTAKPVVVIKLDKSSADIVCGNTLALKATLTGSSSSVTWKSSDTKIATVSSAGKVTAKQAGAVTITASVAGKSATCKIQVLYKDVTNSADFWYAPTNYLTNAGIVKGYDNQTLFKSDNECSRGQMVTFLWRLAGEPKPKATTSKFSDVKSSDYFFKPVLWAVEKGITTGYSDGTFQPQTVCTRAQTVTFMWRMAGKPAPKTTTNKFSDVKSSDYFFKPVLWASEMKIASGYSDGTFKPQGKCLRRQMVTFLYKYDKYVNGKG